jgi:chlorobactene glucosyltransferase
MAACAKGDYLLFLDADVRIGNDLIGDAVQYMGKRKTGLISIFPEQIIESFGEEITVPNMNYILLSLLPLPLVRLSPIPSLAAANGQFMFFNALVYRNHSPHEIMKASKVEDIEISRFLKKNNILVACLLGDQRIKCRMYSGFSDSVNGFSKNVIAFFGNSFILASLFWFTTTLGFLAVMSSMSVTVILSYFVAYLMTRVLVSKASRQNVLKNLLYILPLQLSMGLFIRKAFINKYFGKFEWKGRSLN